MEDLKSQPTTTSIKNNENYKQEPSKSNISKMKKVKYFK